MDFIEFKASENDDGRRLDKIVRLLLKNVPTSLICKNIRTGFIRLNGKKADMSDKVFQHDVIGIEKHFYENSVSEKDSEKKDFCDESNFSLEKITLFKNDDILVLNKPYGMLSQKADKNEVSLDSIIQRQFKDDSLSFKPGPLHRLDRNTTGILCFSQSLKGAQWFTKEMIDHHMQKFYLGIVEGHLNSKVEWQDKLEKASDKTQSGFYTSSISDDDKNRTAITVATPLSYGKLEGKDVTLVEFYIPTGLNHQIRLQSSSHGYPLLGDSAYNAKLKSKELKQKLYLHCACMILPENSMNIPELLTASLNNEFSRIMKISLLEFDEKAYNICKGKLLNK